MKKIITVFLIIQSLWLLAAQLNVDSLETELAFKNPEEQVDVLNKIAEYYISTKPDSALVYAKLALIKAEENNYKKGKATAYSNLGFIYLHNDDLSAALQNQNHSLQLSREITYQEGEANALNNIGNIFDAQSNFDQALDYHLQALEINRQIGSEERIATSYNNLGNIYFNLSHYDKALGYYQKSLELKEKLGEQDKIAGALSNIGNIYFYRENYTDAVNYYQQALDIMKTLDQQQGIAHFTNNIGISYCNLDDNENALEYLSSAQQVYEMINDKRGCARTSYNIANLYFEQENNAKALLNLDKSLQIAEEIQAVEIISSCFSLYSEIYKSSHDYQQALDFHEKHTTLKDSIFSQDSAEKIAEMQVKFETEKKEKENEIFRLELEKQKLVRWRLYFGLIILFSVSFLFYYRYNSKRKINIQLREKIAEALQKQKEQQQIIVHQANLSSLGEMAAGIAHEINQPLQNISLSSESIEMELNDKNSSNEYLNQKLAFIFEDIERIKTISEHISIFSCEQKNEITEKFCLNESVQNAVSMIKKQFEKAEIELKMNLKKDLSLIDGNLYKFEQVVLNLFSNAKDAVLDDGSISMKTVSIRSYESVSEVYLEIEDNGKGISENAKTNIFLPFFTTKKFGQGTGLGLSISYGIIKEMNGKIELIEAEYTTFRVTVPKIKVGNTTI